MAKSTSSNEKQEKDPPVITAPKLPYLPQDPKSYSPKIGLIGCGGITDWHLKAYKAAGYEVAALCDLDLKRAKKQRDTYYPKAKTFGDYQELLTLNELAVVDITTHPPERPPIIEAALRAGKHVLSQKPFVEDISVGQQLADLADEQGLLLAVNQNGRFAPHWSFLRNANAEGLLGQVSAVHCGVHWNHGWVKGTPFEKIKHLILYDFAIHWFDILSCLMGDRRPTQVYATCLRSSIQEISPPLLAQAVVEYEDAQASLVFDADTRFGDWETTFVTGSKGTALCEGQNINRQKLTLTTKKGIAEPKLTGSWFPDGFHGTMGELLCAIEEKRQPIHSAQNNLATLKLCFAAVASAERGEPIVPGTVQSLAEAV